MKQFRITVDGKTYEVEVEEVGSPINSSSTPSSISSAAPKISAPVSIPKIVPINKKDSTTTSETSNSPVSSADCEAKDGCTDVKAPVTGTILKILVKQGDTVQSGQTIIILEAMKMETEVQSQVSGTVGKILISNGTNVSSGQTLLVIESK